MAYRCRLPTQNYNKRTAIHSHHYRQTCTWMFSRNRVISIMRAGYQVIKYCSHCYMLVQVPSISNAYKIILLLIAKRALNAAKAHSAYLTAAVRIYNCNRLQTFRTPLGVSNIKTTWPRYVCIVFLIINTGTFQ